MLILPGSSALSDARFQLLAADVLALDEGWTLREAVHAYAVDVDPTQALDTDRLAALLQPGTASVVDPQCLSRPGQRIVSPRFGTISPWSSKATDIAHNCGFGALRRIERLTLFGIDGVEVGAARSALDALLHDRMVETVVGSFDELGPLFDRSAPRSYDEINLLEAGVAALE